MQPSSRRLRAIRAAPPGLAAGDPDRRATFVAALQQSDDLLAAAAAIGPVSRPLPLYYAGHQAGKAIAAAWELDNWRVTGHGLTQDYQDGGQHKPVDWQSDILRFRVKPQLSKRGPGVFGTVASTLGAALLTGSVELGALWSALPEVSPPPDPGTWLLALPVYPGIYVTGEPQFMSTAFLGYVYLRGLPGLDDAAGINALLGRYADGEGARVATSNLDLQYYPTPWGLGVAVMWQKPDVQPKYGVPIPPALIAAHVTNRLPVYRRTQEHWLIPKVGEDQLPPLLLWWVLLFGLSLLARYEPAAWRAALDLDRSPCADPLTELLDQALVIVPDLLFDAATEDRGTAS